MSLSDSLEHLPPTSGTYDYNAAPNVFATLTVGASDTDPVFNTALRRMTNIGAVNNDDQNYGFPFINLDGTLMFHSPVSGGMNILRVSDGTTLYTGVPTGVGSRTEMRWSHIDPDVYYYRTGTVLRKYTVSTASDVVLKDFGVGNTLQNQGGSLIYQDRTDNLFCVCWASTARVWNRALDLTYTGTVDCTFPLSHNGFIGISPDGAFLTGGAFGTTAQSGSRMKAFAIDNSAHTVDSTGVEYWNIGGAHSTHVSASDGSNFAIVENSNDATGVYAIDMVTDRSSMSVANQKAGGRLLISMVPAFQDGFHMCAVVLGTFKDWAFVSTERVSPLDDFGTVPTGANWYPFCQEVIAVNVLTGALMRQCHHRSRGNLNSNYQCEPRNSCSVTGDRVMFTSNMNDSSPTQYADIYLIVNPLGEIAANIQSSGAIAANLARVVSWARAR